MGVGRGLLEPCGFHCRGLLLKTTSKERDEEEAEKNGGRGVGSYCSGAQT